MANGKIIYGTGGSISYTFAVNFSWAHIQSCVEQDVMERVDSGAFILTTRPNKMRLSLSFEAMPASQKAAFMAAYSSRTPVKIYLDGSHLDFTGQFSEPPVFTSKPVGMGGAVFGGWDCELIFEEI